MRIPMRVRQYIEFEISHYNYYKEILNQCSITPNINVLETHNPLAIDAMCRTVAAIDRALKYCDTLEHDIFKIYTSEGDCNTTKYSQKYFCSPETFNRRKTHLIELVAQELGLINSTRSVG